jgi:hypothetical protein
MIDISNLDKKTASTESNEQNIRRKNNEEVGYLQEEGRSVRDVEHMSHDISNESDHDYEN